MIEHIEHNCFMFCGMLYTLQATERDILEQIRLNGPSVEIPEDLKRAILKTLAFAEKECEHLQLIPATQRVMQIQARLEGSGAYTCIIILTAIQDLRPTIILELSKRKFAFIRPGLDSYFEKDQLFGDRVYEQFRSARHDIKEAGNCLAADLNTAAVFHLMRAAEIGMRILAWDRRVKLKNKAPLELQGWDDILKAVQTEINKIVNWSGRRGLAKVQALEFYNGAMAEFRGFKDAWRNHVMHTRRDYNSNDAKSVLSHASRFMEILATRLSESQRTPRVWTKNEIIGVKDHQ